MKSAILKIDMTSFFLLSPIWIKFRRLVQNNMSTAVIWSKSKPDVEVQYGGRLGELHGMIFGLRCSDHVSDALISLHWLRIPQRIQFKMAILT